MNGRFFIGRSFLALLEEFIISRNNGFMLTAPENYGIVTAAGKNLLPLKKSWLERPGK